jgi:hypothetical protein
MARQSWNGPSVERNEEFGDLSQGTLIFPQDMEKQFYPEAIKFSVLERQGPSYSKLKGNVESSARQAKDALLAKENKPSAEKTAAANALGIEWNTHSC